MIDYFLLLLLALPLFFIAAFLFAGGRFPLFISIITIIVFFAVMVFVIQPQITNMIEESTIETIPSEDIPFILKPGESKEVTVTMIDIVQNTTVDELQLFIPAIDTYTWKSNQYEKIPTTNETYQNLQVAIYSENNKNITHLSNFTTQPYIINSLNVPWLFPMVGNKTVLGISVKYNVTYLFIAPSDVPNETIFVIPLVKENPIIQTFTQPEKKDESNWLWNWLVPIIAWIPTVIMLSFIFVKNRRSKNIMQKSELEVMLKKLEKMNKMMEDATKEEKKKTVDSKFGEIPNQHIDYTLSKMTTPDDSIVLAKEFRDNGYWVKIANFSKSSKNIDKEKCCGVYISNWKKDDYETKGRPKWK